MGLLETRSLSICVVKTIDVPIKSVLFELSALCLFREPSTGIYHLFIIRSCNTRFIASGEYIMAYLRSVEWNIVMLTHPVIGIPIHNQYIFLLRISVWTLLKAQVARMEKQGSWLSSVINRGSVTLFLKAQAVCKPVHLQTWISLQSPPHWVFPNLCRVFA